MRINQLKTYTPNGSRLRSKIKENLISNQNNTTVEIAVIETNFGKGLTKVKTFFNNKNQVVKRIIEKRTGKKNIEKTIFTYDGIYKYRRKTIIDKFINKEKIQTTTKLEVLSREKDSGTSILTRILLFTKPDHNKSRNEIQIIEELSNHKPRKYIKTTAQRNKNGELTNKTIEGNIKNLNKLANSPYLYFRGYKLKDFLISIIPHAKELQKIKNRDINIYFDTLEKKVAANTYSEDSMGTVNFDLSKLYSKSLIVNVVNHEFRHQYQSSMIEKFSQENFFGKLKRYLHPFKYDFAKKCKHGFENYVSANVDEKKI